MPRKSEENESNLSGSELEEDEEEKEQESAGDRLVERKMAHLLPPRLGDGDEAIGATTTFHGKEEFDYKGRSWMAPPAGMASIARSEDELEMDHHKCFVPKSSGLSSPRTL
mgnify:CR=1 FL=1